VEETIVALRADARRNEKAVLDAAGRLLEQAAMPSAVSMDAIAAAAGVGKGTLFRRFGDRDGLIRAVIEQRTEPLRQAIDFGPPPLGPSTPPRQRLLAVLAAITQAKVDAVTLSLAHESGHSSPYAAPGYVETHKLFTSLLDRLDGGGDVDLTAHLLLATTRADLIAFLLRAEHQTPPAIVAAVISTAERVLDGRTPSSR
jgi:AcrR family transcriptional regulator